ncbi:MAG: hypothetical protein ACR2OE_06740 [Thermomicrobiales bacterium]
MTTWDEMRFENEEHLALPCFRWMPQRRRILQARANTLETGAVFAFPDVSDEWARKQLAIMRRYMQVATDEQLIVAARAEGILPARKKSK